MNGHTKALTHYSLDLCRLRKGVHSVCIPKRGHTDACTIQSHDRTRLETGVDSVCIPKRGDTKDNHLFQFIHFVKPPVRYIVLKYFKKYLK